MQKGSSQGAPSVLRPQRLRDVHALEMVCEVYQMVHESHEYLLAPLIKLVDHLPAKDRRSLDVYVPRLDWYGYPPSLVLEAVEPLRLYLVAEEVPHGVLLAPLSLVAGAPEVGDVLAADSEGDVLKVIGVNGVLKIGARKPLRSM